MSKALGSNTQIAAIIRKALGSDTQAAIIIIIGTAVAMVLLS